MLEDFNPKWIIKKQIVTEWFRQLRDELCHQLEAIEGNNIYFERKHWQRGKNNEDLGGGETSLLSGNVFEKAGVHISTVYGEFSKQFKKQMLGASKDPRFWASGISVIIHPRNPNIPAAHMNTRMIITTQSWFAGGGDLTPVLTRDRRADHPDTLALHHSFKQACDKYNPEYYPQFKQECDKYFFLPHRNEPRGTGGIFYEHLNTGKWDIDFSFTQDVGKAFQKAYLNIIKKRMHDRYTEKDREEQLKQRGRYVEFNLLYDRGTMFGLKTGGNIESILSSMPPLVSW